MEYPLRHVSIRVPWHDSGWNGTVCKHPTLNGACTKLQGISEAKKDGEEEEVAGKSIEDLEPEAWPCCIDERAAFMAPFSYTSPKNHPLRTKFPAIYGHFRPIPQRMPPFSAGAVPFNWLLRKNIEHIARLYSLEVNLEIEPAAERQSSWTNVAENQKPLLDCFAAHLKEEDSLCFFYAKHVPFYEGTGRILIGVGRIKKKGELLEYPRGGEGIRGMIWERPIQHSIRPKGSDGFLLPYHAILEHAEKVPGLDLTPLIAHAPNEKWEEFSFASELVSHDGAISALLSIDAALQKTEEALGVPTTQERKWVHEELIRLWKVRGPFPGLGAVLTAMGMSKGLFVAHEIQRAAGENTDPWPFVADAFQKPFLLPKPLRRDLTETAEVWSALSPERRQTLKLLSRFELNLQQAQNAYEEGSRERAKWACSDREFLANPYLLYEVSRHDPEGISITTIDRGVFPDDVVRTAHPLPPPSGLDSAVDWRRVRSLTISVLERAASEGHTLTSVDTIAGQIRELPLKPSCPVTTDRILAIAKKFEPEAELLEDVPHALRLTRYRGIGELIRKNVLKRVGAVRHGVSADWQKQIDIEFGKTKDNEELLARQEKIAALEELAASRFSVLIGSAGTGKTTVLKFLCSLPAIEADGLLLLAPTGKARVRMQQLAGSANAPAFTIAQFLSRHRRYDGRSSRYFLNTTAPKAEGFGTVIVDEASMLTEDMLGALIDSLKGINRLILVGDPSQLPPIGAGRPFVDIVARLAEGLTRGKFPRIEKGYAELTIERRQVGDDRPDLQFARWFSVTPPAPGEDEVFAFPDQAHPALEFVRWDKPEDFREKLISKLCQELSLADKDDSQGFNASLGGNLVGDYCYFNPSYDPRAEQNAVDFVEAWQLLSPLRGTTIGASDINRQIHEQFRRGFIELASATRFRKIPKPFGAERIVYGDKIINLRNHRRDNFYPKNDDVLGYIANGEIGIAVGQFKSKVMTQPPWALKVEFSSQIGYTYEFTESSFGDEREPPLELAYALTVHKAQGSQFNLVIVVLPEAHPILSRELIYTALTRHQSRIVIMHQGPRTNLKNFTLPHSSETARRRTDLFAPCTMVEVYAEGNKSFFLQENLIHRTEKGIAVRSKGELLIAQKLEQAGIDYSYELPLLLDGKPRYPDFTIKDDLTGRTVYWEHLGMLDRIAYKRSWEKKLALYRSHGILPHDDPEAGDRVLVTTQDSAAQGIDMAAIKKLIEEVCLG